LLVFPELSLTGYELAMAAANVVDPGSPVLDPLRQLAAEARMTIVAGAPVRSDRETLHIGALAIRPQGPVVTHTKEHTHYSEEGVFRPGRGGPVLPVEDARVALAICADAKHPEHAATAARRGATVYAASVMIIEEEYGPKAALLEGYARRHRMAVLLANYSGATGGAHSAGKSALWSEGGLLVAASGGTEEALVVGSKHDGVWTGAVLPLSAQVHETAHGRHAFTVENKE
jgi:predicted amidohydrolase